MASQVSPTMVVIAGPNGAGKTTVTRYLQMAGLKFPNYQNADDLALHRRHGLASPSPVVPRRELIATGQSFSYETVLATEAHAARMLAARAAGYHVRLIYIGVESAEICIARVADRVAKGGHGLTETRIRQNFDASLARGLPAALSVASECLVFDNSQGAGAGPQRVAHVIGRYVRDWPTVGLTWPEARLFTRLRAHGGYVFGPK